MTEPGDTEASTATSLRHKREPSSKRLTLTAAAPLQGHRGLPAKALWTLCFKTRSWEPDKQTAQQPGPCHPLPYTPPPRAVRGSLRQQLGKRDQGSSTLPPGHRGGRLLLQHPIFVSLTHSVTRGGLLLGGSEGSEGDEGGEGQSASGETVLWC